MVMGQCGHVASHTHERDMCCEPAQTWMSEIFVCGSRCQFEFTRLCGSVLLLKLNTLYLLASRAQQVPAVSQSAYSPSSSDTGESMLANSPQPVLTKSVPPANIMGLPPTQPTTKVKKQQQ